MHYKGSNVTLRIIALNVIVGLIIFLLSSFTPSTSSMLLPWLTLSSNIEITILKPWTLLTYTTIHAGVVHLIFNMLLLHYIGNLYLFYFKEKSMITTYIIGGILGGIFFLIGTTLLNQHNILIGSSSAVIAILFYLVSFKPQMQLNLVLLGKVRLWHIAVFIGILEIIQLGGVNIGGHLAHFGGALSGFLGYHINSKQWHFLKTNKSTLKAIKKTFINNPEIEQQQKEHIDYLLKKISQSGYDSLTIDEKKYLFTGSKKIRK